MPSRQHESIKNMLNKATRPLKEKGKTPELHHMRHLLELGTFFYLLPWGVHQKQIKIDIKGKLCKIEADLIVPTIADKSKVILYLHGGGYTIGSTNSHRSLVGKIAKKTKSMAVLIDYRKAPENPFPAALEDALASYQSLLNRGKKPENIIIAGDSAGGGLTVATLLAIKEKGLPQPAGGVCLSPWVDLAATGDSIHTNADNDPLVDILKLKIWARMYAGSYSLTHPLVSPLYADLTGISPLLIQCSTSEMLHSDAVRLAEKARNQGVEVELQQWDGLIHWWHLFQRVIPEASEAINLISEFINQRFNQETLAKS